MAFHPREIAMDPTILDRIVEGDGGNDPLEVLLQMEDEWIRDRDTWDYRQFNELTGESNG